MCSRSSKCTRVIIPVQLYHLVTAITIPAIMPGKITQHTHITTWRVMPIKMAMLLYFLASREAIIDSVYLPLS